MIVNPETKAKVLRYAMGNHGNLSITKLAVALDYDAVDALGVRFKDTVNLEVRRAGAGKSGSGSGTIRIKVSNCQSNWAWLALCWESWAS